MTAGHRVPVTVVGGYLGAGKTTLVNAVLAEATEPIAVIVNDFGAVSIDDRLIVAADGETLTLANGCICCSLVDGFAETLARIRARPEAPARILIEASGVALPALVAAHTHGPGLRLDAVIVLADAETVSARAADRLIGDTVRAQLAAADLVVVTKADLVSSAALAAVRGWLHGPTGPTGAPIVVADRGRVPPEVLFGAHAAARPAAAGAGVGSLSAGGQTAPNGSTFRSWSAEVAGPVDRATLEGTLAALPPSVVRVKGIVSFADAPGDAWAVHRVGLRVAIDKLPDPSSERAAVTSRLVAIATAADDDVDPFTPLCSLFPGSSRRVDP